MGETSSPETLDYYRKMTPGENPNAFIQHYNEVPLAGNLGELNLFTAEELNQNQN
jgi:hypothetical protein